MSKSGRVEVLDAWTNPDTFRPAALSNDRLRRLAREYLPIDVSGDPIQFEVNRIPSGWVIELINNAGVTKKPDEPAVINPKAIARVTLKPRVSCSSACAWRSKQVFSDPSEVRVEVRPGALEYVEFH
ncbi:MAG: hypothetical protein M1608_06765 [Candidatus Omnitrophica bacterium]|nr:hypothetical protein [Candidatus Omnitrophota bacterium]